MLKKTTVALLFFFSTPSLAEDNKKFVDNTSPENYQIIGFITEKHKKFIVIKNSANESTQTLKEGDFLDTEKQLQIEQINDKSVRIHGAKSFLLTTNTYRYHKEENNSHVPTKNDPEEQPIVSHQAIADMEFEENKEESDTTKEELVQEQQKLDDLEQKARQYLSDILQLEKIKEHEQEQKLEEQQLDNDEWQAGIALENKGDSIYLDENTEDNEKL